MKAEEYIKTSDPGTCGWFAKQRECAEANIRNFARRSIEMAKQEAVEEIGECAMSIINERKRQIEKEGFDVNADRCYKNEELAQAAAAYAQPESQRTYIDIGSLWLTIMWPPCWRKNMWKPSKDNSIKGRIRELEKAGALILAEMERLKSMEEKGLFYLPEFKRCNY